MPGRIAGQNNKLSALFAGVEASMPASAGDLDIREVVCDSRKVQPRALFFALHGAKADGNAFIRDAVSRGAVAIASEDVPPATIPSSVAWIRVAHARKALAITAANFFGHPAKALQLVAVTGTNGKTTTTSLVDAIIKAAMDRLWGCHFAAAVFTNLTREHMDYHKTFEDYFAAKLRLFKGTGAGTPDMAVLNIDDEYGKRLASAAKNVITYGLNSGARLTTKKFQLSFSGLSFTALTPNGKIDIESSLVGRINVYNILAAIGAAQALGLPNEVIANGIRNLKNVSGRFQPIAMGQPFLVVVDYAHTDDALENLIRTARELNPKGRIITLFGCGGLKDRTKRPVMGEVAGRLSDLTILSTDNPKSEDPLKIISDIVVGLQKTHGKYMIEPDRERAIGLAMDEARAGDILLLAGKGHENYQILADRTLEFDDREMARRALRERGYDRPESGPGFGT